MIKIKAEMYDKLGYVVKKNYFDGTIRAYLNLTGIINKEAFSKALKFMIEETPILHSSFQYKSVRPYWQVNNYDINDAIKYEECTNPEELANDYLSKSISDESNLRISIKVFSNDITSIIVILIDHLCVDGEDFKYFIKALFKNYNLIINKKNSLNIRKGSRSINEIYNSFSILDKIKAKNLIVYPRYNNKIKFPWTEPTENDMNIIIRKKLPKNDFLKLKKSLADKNATVNDALLASMIKSLYELNNKLLDISVASIVDLRRYLKDPDSTTGLTNYYSLMGTTARGDININEILSKISNQTEREKNKKFFALYGIPLLNYAFKYIPFFLAVPIVKNNYVDARLSLSNMGTLEKDNYQIANMELNDFFITGTTKYKPYFLMSSTTFNDCLSISTTIKGNKNDSELAEDFLQKVINNLKKI